MFGGFFSSVKSKNDPKSTATQQDASSSTTTKLEQERQRQQALISQKLKSLELENEFLYEKMTQKGLIAAQSGGGNKDDGADPPREREHPYEDNDDCSTASADEESKSYMTMAQEGYEQLVEAIIRPPRCRYKISDLGPETFWFGDREFERTDTKLMTERGLRIELSVWGPMDDDTINYANQPIIIYLHGNASARLEVLPQLTSLLAMGVKVASLDFAGSGLSDGDYVSLGYHERYDLETAVTHLRMVHRDPPIALWGRSMGAATAIMYGKMDGNLRCMILDSSFSSLVTLAEELVDKARQQGTFMPGVLVSAALKLLQWSVQKRANFDIYDLVPIEHARNGQSIPAIFVHADGDDFILPKHSQDLCEVYPGAKSILIVDGHHNEPRPESCLMACEAFLERYLDINEEWKLKASAITRDMGYPPWYQSNQHQRRRRKPPQDEDSDEDEFELGMTQQRQQEIHDRIHQVFGGQQEQDEDEYGDDEPLTVDSILAKPTRRSDESTVELQQTLEDVSPALEHQDNVNDDDSHEVQLGMTNGEDQQSLEHHRPRPSMPKDDPPTPSMTSQLDNQDLSINVSNSRSDDDDDDDDDDNGFGDPMG